MKHHLTLPSSYYVTLVGGNSADLSHACEPTTFAEACIEYADARDEGRPANVFRMEPPTNGGAGMMIDVTDDAEARIARHLTKVRQALPFWLTSA